MENKLQDQPRLEINCNKSGALVIQQLCDLALKTGGVQNMPAVDFVMRSIVLEDSDPEKEE